MPQSKQLLAYYGISISGHLGMLYQWQGLEVEYLFTTITAVKGRTLGATLASHPTKRHTTAIKRYRGKPRM